MRKVRVIYFTLIIRDGDFEWFNKNVSYERFLQKCKLTYEIIRERHMPLWDFQVIYFVQQVAFETTT